MRTAHQIMMASIAAVVGLTACSSGTPSPTVAKLAAGPTSTTAAPAPGGSPSSGPSGSSSAGGGAGPTGKSAAADLAKLDAYAGCMRSHGVPSFPDPTVGSSGGGGFQLRSGPGGQGIDPQSAAFQAAQNKCKSLLPNGGVAQPLTAAEQQKFLNWAACIRSHGVPSFPDPDFSGGGVRIRVGGQGGPGPDKTGSAFQAAQTACKSLMPGGFGGGG
jgi:hypothetical protein